jgi:hypothetical protein
MCRRHTHWTMNRCVPDLVKHGRCTMALALLRTRTGMWMSKQGLDPDLAASAAQLS